MSDSFESEARFALPQAQLAAKRRVVGRWRKAELSQRSVGLAD